MQVSMAQVENLAMSKQAKRVVVDKGKRVCINCIWYEQYHRHGRGNVVCWVPVDLGNCLIQDKEYNPLKKACKHFEAVR